MQNFQCTVMLYKMNVILPLKENIIISLILET